jgi:hypothetical protein
VHNCPWVGALWARTLRAAERAGCPPEQHEALYNRALGAGLQVGPGGRRGGGGAGGSEAAGGPWGEGGRGLQLHAWLSFTRVMGRRLCVGCKAGVARLHALSITLQDQQG